MIIVQRYAHFLATGLHIWPPPSLVTAESEAGESRWRSARCVGWLVS